MSEELPRLRATRAGNRGVVTKLITEVEQIVQLDTKPKDRLERISLMLDQKWNLLNEYNDKILALCKVEDIEKEIEDAHDLTMRIMDTKAEIAKLTTPPTTVETQPSPSNLATTSPIEPSPSSLNVATTPPIEPSPSSSNVATTPPITPSTSNSFAVANSNPHQTSTTWFNTGLQSQPNSNASYQSTFTAKLPKLVLPKFRGDVTIWRSFWDSFNSAVHVNPGLSKIDKFNYLNSLLEGNAKRAIQGLTLSDANYDSAIEILQQRFGRQQQIISAHMEEILKIPPSHNDSPSSLRLVYDRLNVHVRGLRSLGVSTEQYGSLLTPIVMSKLPNDIRLQIARTNTEEVWNIEDLIETIRVEMEAREASEGNRVHTDPAQVSRSSNNNPRPPNKSRELPTSSTLHSGENQSFQIRCAYCGEHHYSASCQRVSDTASRKEILRKKNRCFICLRTGHRSPDCTSNKKCRNCNSPGHHQSICDRNKNDAAKQEPSPSGATETSTTRATTTAATLRKKGTVLLQTARAVASNADGTKTKDVRILFDNGSQRSYVTNTLKSQLNLGTMKKETLHLNTFGEQNYRKQDCDMVKIHLTKPGCEEIEICALGFPVICSSLPSKVDVTQYPHLDNLEFADDFDSNSNDSIDILIGSDYYWSVVNGEAVRGEAGPTAVNSKLGWLLSGPVGKGSSDHVNSHLVVTGEFNSFFETNEHDELVNTVKKFWETESIGIKEPLNEESNENTGILKHLTYDGKRYVVGLPWKEERELIPSEYQLSRNRLNSLHHKLRQDPELLTEYDRIIKEQLEMGIIEEVKTEVDDKFSEDMHYLPHHAVLRRDRETTKVRVVYDGSAKSPGNNYSLNDCLQVGPNLIPQLFDVLVKFRSDPIALTADIEKAFLMVSMDEASKDMLRFLWFKNPIETTPEVIQLQFCRLVFGLRPSPSILGSTIRYHLDSCEKLNPELSYVISLLRERLYVDDFLGGADSIKKAEEIYKNSKAIMLKGGFNLRKWNSNSKELIDMINSSEKSREECTTKSAEFTQDDESYAKATIGSSTDQQDDKFVKVLGVNWNNKTDELLFNFTELVKHANTLPVTKRSLLKISAKVFDPLGFLSPYVIRLKSMFQELCSEKVDWDKELNGIWLSKWNSFLSELEALNKVRIPRCYFNANSKPNSIQLHGFSDASKQAYAAVVYIRSSYNDGRVSVRLLCSKTRVSPVRQQTIPRLELLGACIPARLMNTVQNSLPEENEKFYWTDSKTVLCWITNEKPWKQYVNHRVAEIRQLTTKEKWRHCPGTLNPADLPSRGMPGHEIVNCSTWWNGPNFLQLPESEWPQNQSGLVANDEAMVELVKEPPHVTHTLTTSEGKPINLSEIIKCEEFGNYTSLLRVTAYILRFVNNVRNKIKQKGNKHDGMSQGCTIQNGELSADEIDYAETCWIRTIQAISFANEIDFLRNANQSKPRRVEQFALFLEEKLILRCHGRINNSTVPLTNKKPILLPSRHPFVDLLIRHTHERVKHSAVTNTLTTLRESFWILKGRQAVKRVLKRCVTCRKLEGLAYSSYNSPDLPSFRVSDDPPFTHTGVDFAGPLYIRQGGNPETEGSKCYICLFTCASTRAVHLELTRSLTVGSFLLAFRRFTSRRGLPATLISDNAKTFKGSSKDVQKIARSKEVMRYLSNNGVTWKFIVEKAPWWGGFWERLIQSVKRCLKKCIGRTTLNYDELHTLLSEVEAVVNSRPLTYVEDDQDGVTYTLCPSHLINGRRITSTPNGGHFEVVSTNASLTRRAKHHRHLLRQFTVQWRKTYLLNLRENHAAKSRSRCGPEVAVGDVVILKGDSTNRMFWKLAKVEELLPGRDGLVRAAIVKVANSDQKPRLMRRSVKHLFPIEVNAVDEGASTERREIACTPPDECTLNTRTRRNAAILADILRKFRS